MTKKDVIKHYMAEKIRNGILTISSHEFELDIPAYGKAYWGVIGLPSSYSRAWRDMREHNELTSIDVLSIERLYTDSKEATWKLKTM
jgi:hypothetical protein